MLTFNDDLHEYRWDGVVKPSVTQVLGKLHDFGMVPRDVLAAACERGTYVHALCEYHDQNDLDDSSVGIYLGYLNAWIKFCADHQAVWCGIEAQEYSQRFGFAGTMDRRGTLRGVPHIVDIKTSLAPHKVWGMQTAAYRQLSAENDSQWLMARRATVQLRTDGTYKLLNWDDPQDWPAFMALITLTNWSSS